jgi:SnoaL-like domain
MAIAGAAISTLAQQFIDAFNQRDADGLVCLVDPAFEWRPSVLVGRHRTYRGHDGLRQWISDLGHAKVQHQARVREVELLEENRFLVHSEVLVDGELMTRSAMVARLGDDGKIVEAQAYLSDEPMLRGTGSPLSVGTVAAGDVSGGER